MNKEIVVKGARQNNLKNLSVTIPRDKFVVFTGVSGSGKSSLAFDTIFAEGQRRYVESLSSYARQFLGQMDKPDVDSIDGLSPAISIDQKTTSHNPRSTVGTVTEIYDYLRLLYARVGTPHCPNCGREISSQTVDGICDKITSLKEGTKVTIIAPVVRSRKGEYSKTFDSLRKSGYIRVRVDGTDYMLDEDEINLDKNLKHDIFVIIDRITVKDGIQKRLTDSIESALKLAGDIVMIENDGGSFLFSTKYSCPDCGISFEEMTPRFFSFNSPYGACPVCHGLGFNTEIDPDLFIKDKNKSINQGALEVSGWNMDNGKISMMNFRALAKHYGFSLDTPYKDLSDRIKNILLYGSDESIIKEYTFGDYTKRFESKFEGVITNLQRRYNETQSDYVKHEIEKYMVSKVCPVCKGDRLKKEALSVTVGSLNIAELCSKPVDEIYDFFEQLNFNDSRQIIASQIVKEIKARLKFLINVGLDYLTLSRTSATLSGGEAQRIRLATQIGSGLTGVLYILDEPSIGLHQRDNEKLLDALRKLRDLGNTLIVVEHDEDTIRQADFVVDIGVGAGENGGNLIASGTPEDIMKCEKSVTGAYLSGKKCIPVPKERKKGNGKFLKITGAKKNNLKNIDVEIPLGVMCVITGVSGSGKSSLINGVLRPNLFAQLNNATVHDEDGRVSGYENLDKVITIDQSPIGRTPRSNPATYTGVFTPIRELFASTGDAKERGYKPGRFSFNIPGGRCENCSGDGIIKIEMHFLSDVYIPCEVCKGKRYNRETLQVFYKGKNISDILDMTVSEACEFFKNIPQIYNKIKTLNDVGLSYIKLGQPATTLSGGEAQRVKLATELSKRQTGKTLYILDEPTTGLHSDDVKKLIKMLKLLVDSGNSVVVIEHNLDVIKVADYIIDLGPEGGKKGGEVIAMGTPEEVAENPNSFTGRFLDKILNV